MKVRSITVFAPASIGVQEAAAAAGDFLARARQAIEAAGVEVQTVRMALPPLRQLVRADATDGDLVDLARRAEQACQRSGVDYVSLGPWQPGDDESHARALVDILAATSRLFITLDYASATRGVDPAAARLAAQTIVDAAVLEKDGMANLRFAALANVPPSVPFLPAAWSDGRDWSFALALECADLARAAFAEAGDAAEGSGALVAAIEEQGKRLIDALADFDEFEFAGIDLSLAPYPRDDDSIGATLESIGVEACGLPGTTAASAILTSALDRVDLPRVGFSGLFLPVLEDNRLALRASEGDLRMEDLLLACTVCGTGLDTVPLPGDCTADDLLPWLLDLGALAVRLDKPLTARLMPMPGLEAGDELEFDFPFFAAGAVMDLPRVRFGAALNPGNVLPIRPRRR
ncbi:DUF711 domain-containing protein [bacterium]|nr:MAG: DUF711 domain-containing protein [bacterium]